MKDSESPRDASSPLGARHDDSSLFSLESLKKAEEDGKKQARNREDSGLIDLKALALMEREAPKPGEVTVAAVVAPPDLFAVGPAPTNSLGGPLIAPLTAPPITTAAAPVKEEIAKPNRTKLIVGVGAVIAIAAGAAVFMTSRAPTADAAATPAVTVAAAPPPAATTAAPPPVEEPKAAAVTPGERPAAPTADAKPAAAPVAAAPKNFGGGAPRSAPPAKAAPKEDAPPPKPVDACDLACQMQRAVAGKK